MKHEEISKGDRMLDGMNYVDMDLVDAAGEDRRQPPLDKKRWPRRILTRVMTAVITMAVVVGLVLTMREKMQQAADSDVGGRIPEYTGMTLDIKEGSWKENETSASDNENVPVADAAVDTVYYLGGTYTRYLGPELLNNASVGAPVGELTELPLDGTSRYAIGTVVYRWSGYDPWLRIAIRSAEGGHYYYERWTEEEREQVTMAEYLPRDAQVTAISLRKRDGTLVGMITDEQEIRSLLAVLREETELSNVTDERAMDPDDGRYMDLILTDGSRVRCMLCDDAFGYSLREFSLPEGFLAKIHSYEIYTIDESLGSVNYGSPLVAEWARPSVREIEPWEDGQVVYTVGSVWLEDGRLCMGHSGCYGPLWDRSYTVLAENVAGDLRIEDMEIWYRTEDGAVAYLYFWYPNDTGRFYEDLDQGADFSSYITKQETLYEGPFVMLQVRDGMVWTLDEKNVLRREEQEVATGVTCFVLDASGTLYGTEDGLYRLSESTGETVRLADGRIATVASGGMTAYYGTADGWVRSVWLDGTHEQDICQMDLRQLCSFPYSRNNGYHSSLLEYEEGLILVDEEDRVWIRKGREEMFLLTESVQTVQYLGDYILRVEYLDGTQENHNLLYSNGG